MENKKEVNRISGTMSGEKIVISGVSGVYPNSNVDKYKCKIPRIVLASGRQETCVSNIFEFLRTKPIDEEEIALLHNFFEKDIVGHTGRGYIILDTTSQSETTTISESIDYYSGIRRPLWFVFSGLGSHWAGMGADLMRIPIFARAVDKCHKVLEPKGVDIVKIISEPDNTIFDNILNVSVGIGAVQIGLTDILKEMGVDPDYIIGNTGLGEITCRYHDNTFNAEEFILSTYSQGQAALENKLAKDWTEIDVRYGTGAVPFEETISVIPSNAVVVEISPHGLLRAILETSHPECTHIPLMTRECQDSVGFLLDAIGKLYKAGYNPKVDILYPKVEFPVSTQTPLLSHLVEWEHSESWPVMENGRDDRIKSSSRDLIISIHDDDYSYIADHVINNITTVPEAALLVYVWETLAMYMSVNFRNLSVIFKDVEFHSDVIVRPEITVKLSVMLNKGNEKFEITQDNILVVSGIASGRQMLKLCQNFNSAQDEFDDIRLKSEDIYKIFSMRGYCYKGSLKSIHSINIHNYSALVKWTNDWVSFLDSLIQINILIRNHNGISKPQFIRELKIDIIEQENSKQFRVDEVFCHTAQVDVIQDFSRCAGVEINNIIYVDKPVNSLQPDILQKSSFYPYFATGEVDIQTAVEVNMQVIAENSNFENISVINSSELNHPDIIEWVQKLSHNLPNISIKVKSETFNTGVNCDELKLNINHTNVLVMENLLGNLKKITKCFELLAKEDFILSLEDDVPKQTEIKRYFNVLTYMSNEKQTLLLLRKLNHSMNSFCYRVTMEHNFSWILRVNGELMTTKNIILISERQPYSGLLGYVKNIKRNRYKNVALISVLDFHAPPFDSNNDFYKDQLEKNLTVNVLKKGQFGGYYYTSCAKSTNLRNFTLKNVLPGNINELTWVEAPSCSAKNTLVQVSFAGLSHKDCQKATNDLKESDNESFGMDFSGIDKYGDRVMGLIPSGAMSSTVEADPDLLWPVPDHWSLEDAATVPLPYVQAYYCLVLKAKITRRQRVLITGGAGALGQAVISICIALNCTVFATVSEREKKDTLTRLFPQLNENNIICCSGNDSLYNIVMKNTQTKGCDLVINCMTGSFREAASKCVGPLGYFLDLTKRDMLANKNIGMSYLQQGRSYISVDISNIFKAEYASDKIILQQYLSKGIARGIVKPLTRLIFSPTIVSRAFRLLSMRRHRGRVLLRLRDPVIMNHGLNVLPRLTYASHEVVVIVCDETCLGVELGEKIVERGAKTLVVHIKPNLISGYEHTKFLSWSKRKVSVKVCTENLHTEQGCATLMKKAMKFGKVKEVFIIQDGKRDDNGDKEDFINVYNKKCLVVLNLDVASRNCTELRYFTIVAHSTQNATDEYALSLSERVCELRNEMGLPALVIRCESLAQLNKSDLSYNKVEPQSLSTFFNALQTSMKMKYKNVLTFDIKNEKNFDLHKKVAEILGVPNLQDLSNDKILGDLNLNENYLKELQGTIKTAFEIDYNINNIRRMNIKSLKNIIENYHCQENTDFYSGVAAFYNEVSSKEEYVLQQPIVSMPTLLSCNNDENTIDPTSTHLIMIPGFEGRLEILKKAAERLKVQAVGIQLGPDMDGASIREMAKAVQKTLKTKLTTRSKFYIMGYSFGVNIALELAAILEEEGHTGVVYCIDSSPDALRIHLDAYLGTVSEDALQDKILHHMFNLMTEQKNKNLKLYSEKLDTFKEKVDTCLKKLKNIVSYSEQFKREILESAYKRIKLAHEYKPKMKLMSKLVLMKGVPHPNADNLTDDYNLSKYSKEPIEIFNLEKGHGLAHQDYRVSNIVNKFLDKAILDDFRTKSLCYVYNA